MPPAPSLRVGRYLAVLLAILVVAYAVVLTQGYTPRLGLDLRGGTSVILTPSVKGGSVNQDQLNQAVDIIRQRVNGVGVAEAEVVTQGQNIVISVPGVGREVVNNLGSTAQLRFREVLQQAAPGPAAGNPATSPAPAVASPAPAAPGPTSAAPSPTSAAPSPAPAAPSPQGKAMSDSLLAAPDTPAPAAPGPASPAPASPAPVAPAPATPAPPAAEPVPPADQGFSQLDCTKPANRQGTGSADRPEDQIVACAKDGKAKYLLAPAKVVGTDVKGATARLDPSGTSNQWEVNVSFTDSGQKKFTDLTAATVGKQVAIALDGVVISAPTIQNTIPGDAQITGSFTKTEAQNLANVLRYGALPLTFTTSQAQSISPTLGTDQLHAGLLAGGIGLALVILYSLLYYRGLGLVTVASLAVAAALSYAAVSLLGAQLSFTLTLAGIAGLIVSIGITADSFIVYYERVKDEMREGRTLRSAVDRGWLRARRTIITADFVSFLAAAILYFLSVGAVRGFAFTLGLSTIIDVVVVFVFTRPVVTWLARTKTFSRPGFTGLGVVTPAPSPSSPPRRGGRRPVTTKGA